MTAPDPGALAEFDQAYADYSATFDRLVALYRAGLAQGDLRPEAVLAGLTEWLIANWPAQALGQMVAVAVARYAKATR